MQLTTALRTLLQILIVILQAVLMLWVACLPLAWLLRDGLGPDAVESGWAGSLFKCTMLWGVPALALALPLFGLSFLDRRLAVGKDQA